MQKLNKKTKTKPVGENCVFPHSKGITLIALIITIIVMIILVGVTVNIAINGGLFKTAQEAAEGTQYQADYEILQAGVVGAIASESGITQSSLQNNLPEGWTVEGEGPFTVTSPGGNKFTVEANGTIESVGSEDPVTPPTADLPEGWTETTKPAEWDNEKIIAVTDGTNTIPLPEGYQISDNPEENTIEKGLVIKDSKENEFVWIPVNTDFTESYSRGTDYLEPKELTINYSSSGAPGAPCDSQDTLDYLYGEGFYNYETDFAYNEHYAEMVESVNKYNGFYIGRYETTIDGSNQIGSVGNATVLTAKKTIPQTNNKAGR